MTSLDLPHAWQPALASLQETMTEMDAKTLRAVDLNLIDGKFPEAHLMTDEELVCVVACEGVAWWCRVCAGVACVLVWCVCWCGVCAGVVCVLRWCVSWCVCRL